MIKADGGEVGLCLFKFARAEEIPFVMLRQLPVSLSRDAAHNLVDCLGKREEINVL